MTDHHQPTDQTIPEQAEYRFVWKHALYTEAEQRARKRERSRGTRTFALVMAAVFFVCFLVLGSVLLLSEKSQAPADDRPVVSAPSVSPAVAVSECICPATVLIYAENISASGAPVYGSPMGGTGFFIRSDGYILTNAHVIKGYNTITVTRYDGSILDATVVGRSDDDDIAVLKVSGSDHPTAPIGDSGAVRVGELAIAVGHPSVSDAPWSVTQGIISGLDRKLTVVGEGRSYEKELTMLQMDTPVNKGNSGGPLANAEGEVIGVVTRKLGNAEGIGYAIPITGAMEVAEAIMEGRLDRLDSEISSVHPYVGLQLCEIRRGDSYRNEKGVFTTALVDGLLILKKDPECRAEIEVGEIITMVDQISVTTVKEYRDLMEKKQNGEDAYFTVYGYPDTKLEIFPVGP